MFEKLPLHDAVLHTIQVDWAARSCVLTLDTSEADNCQLVFAGVTELVLPRHEPWGPSASINSLASGDPTNFTIEMQSGDVLSIDATSWQFIPGHAG